MPTINFFWGGDNFQFLNRLAIASHLLVGHEVIIWLNGKRPNSIYWVDDIVQNIKDANESVNLNKFSTTLNKLNKGMYNLNKNRYKPIHKVLSSPWRFEFLFKYGGIYCDVDGIALKKFPEQDWIIATDSNKAGVYTCGFMKAPARQRLFKTALKFWMSRPNPMAAFSRAVKLHKLNLTNQRKDFFPFTSSEHSSYLKSHNKHIMLDHKTIYNSYSVHFFGNKTRKYHLTPDVISKYKDSVLYKLMKKVFHNFPIENN